MSTLYTGVIKDISKNGKYGFIDRKEVYRRDGIKADLKTRSDVFIHCGSGHFGTYPENFKEGVRVSFYLSEDTKRKNAYRVTSAQLCPVAVVRDAIELHFDQRHLDHPMIPIRWCITPEMFKVMRENITSFWYIAIVAQKRPKNEKGHFDARHTIFKSILGLDNISLGQGFLEMKASGEYDIVAYLVESPLPSNKVRANHRETDIRTICVWRDFKDMEITVNPVMLDFMDGAQRERVHALTTVPVSVPTEIFAKPIPEWVRTWLSYFLLDRPKDECRARWHIPFAFTFGVIIYLALEGFTRAWWLLIGLLHILPGGSPMPAWRFAFARQLSVPYPSDPLGKDEYKDLEFYEKKWCFLLRPLVLIIIAIATVVCVIFPIVPKMVASTALAGILIFGVYFVLSKLFPKWFTEPTEEEKRKKEWDEKQAAFTARIERKEREKLFAQQKAEKKYAKALDQVAQFAVCNADIPDVQSKPQPRSITLVWSGIKRKVCRPYNW